MQTPKIMETDADRKREKTVASKIEQAWNCQLVEMPKLSWFDYCASRDGKIVAYIEIKTRTNSQDAYSTYMISATKITKGLNAARVLRIKFLLVVQFTDALMFVDVSKAKFSLGIADRKDVNCIEVVLQIPMNEFKTITLNKEN